VRMAAMGLEWKDWLREHHISSLWQKEGFVVVKWLMRFPIESDEYWCVKSTTRIVVFISQIFRAQGVVEDNWFLSGFCSLEIETNCKKIGFGKEKIQFSSQSMCSHLGNYYPKKPNTCHTHNCKEPKTKRPAHIIQVTYHSYEVRPEWTNSHYQQHHVGWMLLARWIGNTFSVGFKCPS
jgi:hypothetical protein